MKKSRLKIRTAFLVLFALVFPVFLSTSAKADAVTDNLSVAVGYAGMELWEYVEVGDYHWSELANELPIYEQAYSYYNNRSGDGTEFTAVVDSARGILLIDLLNYAKIYYGDIYNLQFYVVDHDGIQAAFDRDALFQTRYYFEDYNGHLYREYDDDFTVISVDSSECWDYSETVEPMLALEDNWVNYTEEFEHALPDFEYMTTANRFRLLFGQTYPEESLTSSSAKYVRTIYVTLVGKPEISGEDGGELPELDGSYGSHTVTVDVSVHSDVRSAVDELLDLHSTNEAVLQIDEVKVTPDDFYENIVHVQIDYQIVGEGEASITGSFGSLSDGDTGFTFSKPVQGGTESPADQTDDQENGDNSDKDHVVPESDDNQGTNGDQNPDNNESNRENTGTSDTENRIADNSAGKAVGKVTEGNVQKLPDASKLKPDESLTLPKADAEESEVLEADSAPSGIYRLSDNIQSQLNGGQSVRSDAGAAVTENVTEVTIEDHTQEKNERMQLMRMIAGAGTAGLLALGCIGEKIAFRIRTRA